MKPISFNQKCYNIISKIPAGKVTTYSHIAHFLGTKAYRAVGNAMAKNPNAPIVPCHRVVNSNGKIGNYAFGKEKKIAMLKAEGIEINNGEIVNLENYLHVLTES